MTFDYQGLEIKIYDWWVEDGWEKACCENEDDDIEVKQQQEIKKCRQMLNEKNMDIVDWLKSDKEKGLYDIAREAFKMGYSIEIENDEKLDKKINEYNTELSATSIDEWDEINIKDIDEDDAEDEDVDFVKEMADDIKREIDEYNNDYFELMKYN